MDIGCGTGTFLALAKRYGWNLTGIEISEKLSEKCKQNVPEARIITKRFEDVDLEEVSTQLVAILRETLQPEFLSFWLTRISPDKDVLDENQLR